MNLRTRLLTKSWPPRPTQGRRAHPRAKVAIGIELIPEGSSEVIHGATVNLSRGGMLANLEYPLSVHDTCMVRFPDSVAEMPSEAPMELPGAPGGQRCTIPAQAVEGRVTRVCDLLTAAVDFTTTLHFSDQ